MVRIGALGIAVLIVVTAAALTLRAFLAGGTGHPQDVLAAATSTAKITRTDLVDRQSFPATLGYGATMPLVNHLSGSVTAEPAAGSVIDRGQALYAVEGKSVYLMFGTVPVYRDLKVGVSDGDDVKELEQNLLALGYANSGNLVADGHFDSRDEAAVKRWQKAVGLGVDGEVHLGQVVFEPAAIRIASWHPALGEGVGPGSPIAEVTSTSPLVTLNLDARRQTLAAGGSQVTVTLPDGKTTNGHIQAVGTVATAGSGNNPATIPVYISLDDAKVAGSLDQAPVTVGLAGQTARGVLAVPVNALLAQPDGTYTIEVVRPGGRHELVPVKTGLFAQGLVEIGGAGLAEGDSVVVPAQ